jgi:hypothetical protein
MASGLTHKHKPRMEMPAKDKHSSLLQIFVNYVGKKFYNIGSMLSFQLILHSAQLAASYYDWRRDDEDRECFGEKTSKLLARYFVEPFHKLKMPMLN